MIHVYRMRSSWATALALVVASLSGCGDDDPGPPADAATLDAAQDAGPSCTVGLFDPESSDLHQWPDPTLLREDATRATGFHLYADPARFDALFARLASYTPIFVEDLPSLDGFGSTSGVFFRFGRAFSGPIPTGLATASPAVGVGLAVLDDAPRLVPVETETTDRGETLVLRPLRPLPEQSWAAAFVTRALTDAAGGCLEPSAGTAAWLASPDERTAAALASLEALGVSRASIVALAVYPVATMTLGSLEVAADIRAREISPATAPTCADEPSFRRCRLSFEAQDFREEDGVYRGLGRGRPYVLPVTVWLPLEGEGPFPTIVWGSGLGSGREQGNRLASHAAPRGFAAIAVDAVSHGDHPDVPADAATDVVPTVMRFFTIGELDTRALAPLRLRDHFRQSAWDKLQLVRLIQHGLDLDDDGTADLDASRLAYLGVSLGGIMGPELLATSDAFDAAVLVVPGGRVSSIIGESDTFGALTRLLRPRGTTDGDVDRFFPVLQTFLDPGDAAVWGPHVQVARLVGDARPDVLAGVVLDDGVVPNRASWTLMRAMELPIVGVELLPVVDVSPIVAPVAGNGPGGRTAGFLQFDVIRRGGELVQATHDNVGDSEQGIAAWLTFLETHFDEGVGRIDDPYVTTGVRP